MNAVLTALEWYGPQTAKQLAQATGLSEMTVYKHLAAASKAGQAHVHSTTANKWGCPTRAFALGPGAEIRRGGGNGWHQKQSREKHVRLALEALKVKRCTVRELCEAVGVTRLAMYAIIEDMTQQGLVHCVNRNHYTRQYASRETPIPVMKTGPTNPFSSLMAQL